MKRKRMPVLAVLIFAFLTSCGSSMMLPATTIIEAPASHALVTFVRTTSYGGTADFELWDADKFVGIIDPKSYVQYEATPGPHTFLGFVDDWYFINAELEAGKHYFIVANMSMGMTAINLVFRPINKDDAEFDANDVHKWLTSFDPTTLDQAKGAEYERGRVRYAKSAMENFDRNNTNLTTLSPDECY